MNMRILVADDDPQVLMCYRKAFASEPTTGVGARLAALSRELFVSGKRLAPQPVFEVDECSQGDEAVSRVADAVRQGQPFDVAILDIRMPPGINGMEAGRRIRELDPAVPIVFISGYSDITKDELKARVPPPSKLHFYDKPLSFGRLAREITTIVGASAGSRDHVPDER